MKKRLSVKEKRQLRIKPTTIEKIECDNWGSDAPYPSHLVTTIYALRKKDLSTFTTEDLRIVIGQNQSLPILVPIALGVLRSNILAEGNYYPGDLLRNVLTVDATFWKLFPDLKKELLEIFERNNKIVLTSEEIDDTIRREILFAYKNLQQEK